MLLVSATDRCVSVEHRSVLLSEQKYQRHVMPMLEAVAFHISKMDKMHGATAQNCKPSPSFSSSCALWTGLLLCMQVQLNKHISQDEGSSYSLV